MKLSKTLSNSSLVLLVFCTSAFAEPQNGFGLNAGYASYSRSCGCTASTTSGLSVGIDYQFAQSSSFSINPFLMVSSETSPKASSVTVSHNMLGVELRHWSGEMFLGGHVGLYSEVLTSGAVSLTGNGLGFGLVAGWESHSGLYVMGQYDASTVDYSGLTSIPMSGLRLSLGYRWK